MKENGGYFGDKRMPAGVRGGGDAGDTQGEVVGIGRLAQGFLVGDEVVLEQAHERLVEGLGAGGFPQRGLEPVAGGISEISLSSSSSKIKAVCFKSKLLRTREWSSPTSPSCMPSAKILAVYPGRV